MFFRETQKPIFRTSIRDIVLEERKNPKPVDFSRKTALSIYPDKQD